MSSQPVRVLYYLPGQKVTIFLDLVDGYGVRTDSITVPTIERIIFPDLSLAAGLPQNMIKLDTGLYYYQFILPTNAAALGTYEVCAHYTNIVNGFINIQSYQVIVW